LPFIGIGGPGDLIDRKLLADRDLFYRIPLGGRPMGAVFASDDKTVLVANYLRNSVQRVDIVEKKVIAEYRLGGASEPSLARKGAAIFYDGRRSLDQWYSCHTCHNNGGVNAKPMDTHNDGTELTNKTVLPLYHLNQTKPWTWHGWQTSLDDAMTKSFMSTMQGRAISREDSAAILDYLSKLDPGPNPFRTADGGLSTAAVRGKAIFNSKSAACIDCHNGPHFTDGKIHDVGLGSERDRYDGFNTPALTSVYQKVRFLHDGRAKSLEAVLNKYHSPEDVSGERALKEDEVTDLIEYLKSL